ncbi:MAG: histidinol dehydrogenase [Sphaerochaetaceae bacterium]|jgi:histidinol dehydrogenase|nr:histidinol dehydrogenase [Sphaerochaetaceae bacterium]NLO60920.1 histidinol dehydrogenase [Spirochaetales bacterium]MDD2405339.1 histidinol dehydrogenase [Sphaerochaetaceae bacterium]MDD3671128.1 histidinol dehydrogenase [Sphaerochaetaceae bacterium]MDD4258277.1 histidinol dehydrogenase [Sphaerochaetaceae bacterium]
MIRLINPDMKLLTQYFSRKSSDDQAIREQVVKIVDTVRQQQDTALLEYVRRFDHVQLPSLEVTQEEIEQASSMIDLPLRRAIDQAAANILKFHQQQKFNEQPVETEHGVCCWRKRVPIHKVGLYVPGGTAVLFSTVLMLAIPAMVAQCPFVVLCTPPRRDGTIDPAVLYCASKANVSKIFKVGGAQAIAAMAYGTQTIQKVDKIFGPGNRYVTMAKQLVANDACAIDMPAGPSEVMVLADTSSRPEFVAADLLSQAEHGNDSQCILVIKDEDLGKGESFALSVERHIKQQIKDLNRIEFIEHSLSRSVAIIVKSTDRMLEISETYAPEHLIIQTTDAETLGERIINAGSVFIGQWSPESVGDYASGTNHTLPTAGWAVSYSGVCVDSFTKAVTYQRLTPGGLKNLGPAVVTMANAESLEAHANAVKIRLTELVKKESI